MSIFSKYTEQRKQEVDSHIGPDIRALIERGNVTPTEMRELRANSWEREALVPVMTDEALINSIDYALKNCCPQRHFPNATYDDAVVHLFVPELMKRFMPASQAAHDYAGTIDAVREALGMEATHYLVIAGDVKELVEAVELSAQDGGVAARKKLRELREQGAQSKCSVCGATSTPLDGCRGTGQPCILSREIPK